MSHSSWMWRHFEGIRGGGDLLEDWVIAALFGFHSRYQSPIRHGSRATFTWRPSRHVTSSFHQHWYLFTTHFTLSNDASMDSKLYSFSGVSHYLSHTLWMRISRNLLKSTNSVKIALLYFTSEIRFWLKTGGYIQIMSRFPLIQI